MNTLKKIVLLIFCIFPCISSYAYDEHAIISYYALNKDLKGLYVKIEPLSEFLTKEQFEIAKALSEAELWCKNNIPEYKPLPDVLAFTPGINHSDVENKFLKSIRINPEYFRYNYVQDIGGNLSGKFSDQITDWKDLYIINLNYHIQIPFLKVKNGDTIPAINIISTASDIPDYGIDCGLFENNNSDIGKIYGFGNQPFADPTRVLHQQAPFHMPYYHNPLLTAAIPNLKSPYAIYRVKYYTEIAKVAFKTKHYYWGYYFSGLALHYVVDCCMPYHISVCPGTSDQHILDEINKDNNYINQILLPKISAEHLFMESYIYNYLIAERNGYTKPYFINAIKNNSKYRNITSKNSDMFIVNILGADAFNIGEQIGPLIENITDKNKMQSEITGRIDSGNYYVDDFILPDKDQEKEKFKNKCYDSLKLAGNAARTYWRKIKRSK